MLIIGMWGNDGSTNHYIGQAVLQQPMTESQCEWMIQDEQWASSFDNEYYFFTKHCLPKECAGKDKCE